MDNYNEFETKTQCNFATNLKQVLKNERITQKQFAEKMGILESTVSNCNKKLPTTDFLVKFKKLYPHISIDDMLFGKVEFVSNSNEFDNSRSEIRKIIGSYYFYYADTISRNLSEDKKVTDDFLRMGVLHISEENFGTNKASCRAVFEIKNRVEADELIDFMDNSSLNAIDNHLQNEYERRTYEGVVEMTRDCLYINLNKEDDGNKTILIIMKYTRGSDNINYIGGLGSMNLVDFGREEEPVSQVVAISRKRVLISDEEIQENLLFSTCRIDVSREAEEIIELTEKLYRKKSENQFGIDGLEQYIPEIIKNNINKLVYNSVKDNLMMFGRVSKKDDERWYKIIKEQ